MSQLLAPGVLLAVLLITAVVVVAMLVGLLAQRVLRHRRERAMAELDQVVRPLVLQATIAEPDELPALQQQVQELDPEHRLHAARTASGLLRELTGEAADGLRALAETAGATPRLRAAAGDADEVLRARAAEALGLLRPQGALELLLTLADDASPEVRAVAIRALGAFPEPRAVERVIAALALDSGVPMSVAASALLDQGVAAAEPVSRALAHDDPGIRRGAARVAGLLQAPGSGPALAALVDDEHEPVRLAAMRSLELLPVREALPALARTALDGGMLGEAAALAIAAAPASWRAEAMQQIDERAEPGVRRAAGLPGRTAA